MKKIISAILSILTVLSVTLVLASCGDKQNKENNESQSSTQNTAKPQKIIMGFDAEYPPFTYVENEKYVGFDIEYASKVFEKLGYTVEYKAIDWNAKDESLTTGAIDCIWSGFTYEGRENGYAWTERYLDNTIVVLTNNSEITTLADLAGKIVAVQSDSSGEAALAKKTDLVASLKDGKYLTDGSYNTSFEKLKTGAYDAVVVDVGVARYLKASLTDEAAKDYVILEETVSTETYGVGFRKEDSELAKKVSDAMVEVAKDTKFVEDLCTKYGVDYKSFTLGK